MEAHDEFIQQIENGTSKIRFLSIITVVVSLLLVASYIYQLLLPFFSSTRIVSVSLLNPGLLVMKTLLLILGAAWVYVGIINYLFSTRMGRAIQKGRAMEKEMEKRITGTTG